MAKKASKKATPKKRPVVKVALKRKKNGGAVTFAIGGRSKCFTIGDIHTDLMDKLKHAMFNVSNLNTDIAYWHEQIKQDPKKYRVALLPKIRDAKKQLIEARKVAGKLRSAINRK